MTENNKNEENSEVKDENKEKEQIKEETESKTDTEEPKTKFTFKCTRSDKCCLTRGPIPLTFWDLELWARNGVVANFFLKPLPPPPKEGEEEKPRDPFGNVPIEDLLEVKCPLYNKEKKECLVYDNRALSCRTYPLEFDGKNYIVVDVECEGVGEEGMTKDDLKEMRDTAKQLFYELTRIRIALPVLSQLISQKVMMDLMRQNMEAMSKMSEEDRSKLDEILKKDKEPQPD